mgnify:FL=1
MNIADYRQSHPRHSTRVAFCSWLNGQLPAGVTISIPYLRDLESGRSVPSLLLAVSVEKATGGVVSTNSWPGLSKRLHKRKS